MTTIATCRHTKTNGRVCQSPALTGGALCFFHNKLHQTHRRPADAQRLTSEWQEDEIQVGDGTGEDYLVAARVYPNQDEIRFPPLEDAESVQLATSMLFQAIATGQIQFKRARLLIATLKIACINQRALATSRAADAEPVPNHIDAPSETASAASEPGTDTAAGCPMFDGVDHGVTHSPTQPDTTQTPSPAANLKPPNSNPEIPPTPAQSDGLKISNLQLEIHSQPTQPPPNPNQNNILDLTHLDTGFCRKRHRANH